VLRPKFTDLHRYPNGYVHATDVAKTFARLRREQVKLEKTCVAIEAEQLVKVRRIGGVK
jgi:hypothetical protein